MVMYAVQRTWAVKIVFRIPSTVHVGRVHMVVVWERGSGRSTPRCNQFVVSLHSRAKQCWFFCTQKRKLHCIRNIDACIFFEENTFMDPFVGRMILSFHSLSPYQVALRLTRITFPSNQSSSRPRQHTPVPAFLHSLGPPDLLISAFLSLWFGCCSATESLKLGRTRWRR